MGDPARLSMSEATSNRLRQVITRNTLSSLVAYHVPILFGYVAVAFGLAEFPVEEIHVIYGSLLLLVATFLLITRNWPVITPAFADRMLLAQIIGWVLIYMAWLITLRELRGFGLIGAVVVFTFLFAYGSLRHSIILIILFSILHLCTCYIAIHVLGQKGDMRWELLFFFQFPLVYLFMARLGHRLVDQRRELVKSKQDLEHSQAELEDAMARLRLLATTDSLTGLLNRRAIEEELERLHDLTRRGDGPFCMLLCDIDHFKAVNDRLGHDAGDEVLRQVAGRLRGMVRRTDRVARWGGEEFLVVLANTRLAGALVVARKMLRQISEPMQVVGENGDLRMTLSVASSR